LSRGEGIAGDPLVRPASPSGPPLIETRPASFSCGCKVAEDKTGTGWSRLDRWGRAGPLPQLVTEIPT
jgi:hypothetical protein